MGLAATLVREPQDADITGAYYRLLRVENHYPIVEGLTVPNSTIISECYRAKANRTSGDQPLTYHSVAASGVITTTAAGYQALADDLAVINAEV